MSQSDSPLPDTVTTFGSALVRAAPDTAHITFRVRCLNDDAVAAFIQTRDTAREVREVLAAKAPGADVRTSNISLHTETSGWGVDMKVLGQRASITFTVSTPHLDDFEHLLTEIVQAGAHQIDSVTFHTRRLKQIRAEARRRAVAAAREKALIYTEAAGVRLGRVVAITDRNPAELGRTEGHGADLDLSGFDEEHGTEGPGAITVAAAVVVVFALVGGP